ncbi:Hypothetical predicted protein [Mytilus galloprovincialis]|uniref:Uncharacterized protein n=1 Tax=Mytilus galloprovincialis TaxID=29158 RepID=A0A8B6G269_MYTGA|nr:Hypothetical predicted protein [Mytilus galloprovincialis]
MLLDKGADFNKCDKDGWSPVMSACRNGHIEIVRILLDTGTDYDQCNSDGWSPVMLSCIEGHTEILRVLLDIGADYNKCNNKGQSSVIIASASGYSDIVHAIHEHSRKEKARKKRGNLKGNFNRKRRLDSSESDEDVPLARLKEKIKSK